MPGFRRHARAVQERQVSPFSSLRHLRERFSDGSARAGRYDSTERHCNNCPGFKELQSAYEKGILHPFVVSKEEFESIRRYRRIHNLKDGDKPGRTTRAPAAPAPAPAAVVDALQRLQELLKKEIPEVGEGVASSESEPGADEQFAAEELAVLSPSSSLLPMDPSSSAQPQQLYQFLPQDSLYDLAAPVNDAQQVAAVPSLIDPFGGFDTFAAGPGVLFPPPPYGLYPANPPTWPNMAFDPTAFGPLF